MKLNQRGITLVELIGALALVSIIAVIAWTALSIGLQHTAHETGKTKLQQEANAIVTKLSAEHRRTEHYYLQFQDGHLQLDSCYMQENEVVCTGFQNVSKESYVFSGTVNTIEFAELKSIDPIYPKEAHVNFSLKVSDPLNSSNSVSVNTTLTRILTSQN